MTYKKGLVIERGTLFLGNYKHRNPHKQTFIKMIGVVVNREPILVPAAQLAVADSEPLEKAKSINNGLQQLLKQCYG